MASVNSPLLSNAIRNDVPAINAIIKALAKADPSILSDLESGTKRFYEGTNGWEFQELVNGSWVTRTKFNIDAQSVDGYNTSVDAVASTIVVRDTNGKLKGNLTGKADTAGTADKLASTLTVPAGGTGATTAAAARTNLGVPPTNHASTTTTYGVSSGTEYGHPKASTTTPKPLGTAAVGLEESSFARGDHVHPITKGNASTFGAVTLSDSTSSTSDASANIAATPKAVKAAYDKAIAAVNVIPLQSGNAGASLVTDGTSTLWHPVAQDVLDAVRIVTTGSDGEIDIYEPLIGTVAHEMGSWWISLDSSIPVGGLPHLGHLCSRATYGDFWTWCELNKTVVSEEEWLAYADSHNGCCPYYSYGDGSTTFRTPKYDQSFLKVLATIGDAGKMEEAGLPNITGALGNFAMQDANATSDATVYKGCFSPAAFGGGGHGTYKADALFDGATFDASRSSPIYGNSDTVTPQNFGVIVGVYAVGAVSAPIGETDAANLLNGLSTLESQLGGVVRSVNGVSADAAGNVDAVSLMMPDYSAGVTFSSLPYTAPATGFVFVNVENDLALTINNKKVYENFSFADIAHFNVIGVMIPISKGEVVRKVAPLDETEELGNFRQGIFYPLKGA